MLWRFLSVVGLIAATAAVGQNVEESGANILVIGSRPETQRKTQGPYEVRIAPQGTLRAEADSWLRRESFVAQPQSGQSSPGQFALPKFRNFDTQLSAIDIDGIPIHDPYAGIPFITDVDLRAFQSLTIHRGIPSYAAPALTPGGSLSFHLGLSQSKNELGQIYGVPYGQATYLKSGIVSAPLKGQLYARGMQSSGRYRFYDDNGTPFNTSDDRYRRRDHNDQKDQLLFPFMQWDSAAITVKALGIHHTSDRAIPVVAAMQDTATDRVQITDKIVGWVLEVKPAPTHAPGLSLSWQHLNAEQDRVTSDGRSPADPTASDQVYSLSQTREGFVLKQKGAVVSTHVAAALITANAELADRFRTALALERHAVNTWLGIRVDVPETPLYWEMKGEEQRNRDRVLPYSDLYSSQERELRRSSGKSYGATVGLADVPLNPTFQVGLIQRLPSMFEAYGDGVSVLSQQELTAETIRHYEFSVADSYRGAVPLAWFISVYRDSIADKIVLIPSRSQILQAQNLRDIRQEGADLTLEVSASPWSMLLNYSYQKAVDKTFSRERKVPLSAEHTAVGEVSYSKQKTKVFALSRYVAKVYRDTSNSLALPAHRTEDLGVEHKFDQVMTSVLLQNIFDVTSGIVVAGDQSGRTARADFRGRPLPGRQVLATVAVQF